MNGPLAEKPKLPKPATRTEIFWRSPETWPMEAAGYVVLLRAFHQIGRAIFGSNWTGKEGFAEKPTPPRLGEFLKLSPALQPMERLRAAEAEFKADGVVYSRAVKVQREIARLAQARVLATAWRKEAGGNLVPIPPEYWNTEQLSDRFIMGQMSLAEPFGYGFAGVGFGWIFVEAGSLNQVLRPSQPAEGGAPVAVARPDAQPIKPELPPPPPSSPPTAAGKAGSKAPKLERAQRAIAACFPSGVPDVAALSNKELCRKIADWLKVQAPPQGAISDDTILRAAGRRSK
jgi:hypothetical protein